MVMLAFLGIPSASSIAKAIFDTAISAALRLLADGVRSLLDALFSFIATTTEPVFTSGWWTGAGHALWLEVLAISGSIMVVAVMLAALEGMWSGSLTPMVKALGAIPGAVIKTAALVGVVSLLVSGTDQVANYFDGSITSQLGLVPVNIAAAITATGMIGMLFAAVVILAVLGLWAELALRAAVLYLVVMTAPMVIAASVHPRLRQSFTRLAEIGAGVIFSKVLIALALSVAFSELSDVSASPSFSQGVAALVACIATLGISCFAPFVLFRLFALEVSHLEGLARRPVRAARDAQQVSYYNRGGLNRYLGRFAGPGAASSGPGTGGGAGGGARYPWGPAGTPSGGGGGGAATASRTGRSAGAGRVAGTASSGGVGLAASVAAGVAGAAGRAVTRGAARGTEAVTGAGSTRSGESRNTSTRAQIPGAAGGAAGTTSPRRAPGAGPSRREGTSTDGPVRGTGRAGTQRAPRARPTTAPGGTRPEEPAAGASHNGSSAPVAVTRTGSRAGSSDARANGVGANGERANGASERSGPLRAVGAASRSASVAPPAAGGAGHRAVGKGAGTAEAVGQQVSIGQHVGRESSQTPESRQNSASPPAGRGGQQRAGADHGTPVGATRLFEPAGTAPATGAPEVTGERPRPAPPASGTAGGVGQQSARGPERAAPSEREPSGPASGGPAEPARALRVTARTEEPPAPSEEPPTAAGRSGGARPVPRSGEGTSLDD